MYRRVWALCLFVALLAPGIARADQTQLFIAGTAITGVHKDADTVLKNAYVVALPSFALRSRHKQYELLLEDVPGVGPLKYNTYSGQRKLTVGYGDAVLRYWLPGGHVALGFGDSLYVRQNDYSNGSYDGVRTAGTRYEIVGAIPLTRDLRVLARLDISPSMHQRYMQWITRPSLHFYEFGKASLVDASMQMEQQRGGGHTWVWGVRYLNYAGGNFPPYWDHAEERTGVVSPFAAWGFSIGSGR